MMGLPTIRALAQFAGATARRTGFQPYHPECVEDINLDNPEFRIPFLGSYVAPGWRRIEDVWLVDKTGWGKENGPALRFRQFVQKLREHYVTRPGAGYALIFETKTEAYVAAFEAMTRDEIAEALHGGLVGGLQ